MNQHVHDTPLHPAVPLQEATPTLDARRCSHVNESGQRCRAYATRSGLCAGHTGLGVAANPKAYAHHGAARSAEVRHQRAEERKRGYLDALRGEFEARAEQVVERLLDIAANGSDADALRAIEQMTSRLYGKPKETVAVDTEIPKTEQAIAAMTIEQRRAILLRLEREGRLQVIEGGGL